jgi:hypothetical protein
MVADHRELYRSLVSDQAPADVIDLMAPRARRAGVDLLATATERP